MTNLVLAIIGMCGMLLLCGVIGTIRVWKEVKKDETEGY